MTRILATCCFFLILVGISVAIQPTVALATPPFDDHAAESIISDITDEVRAIAKRPYSPPDAGLPESLQKLDYDGYRKIVFKRDKAIHLSSSNFELELFHRGYIFPNRVQVVATQLIDYHRKLQDKTFEYKPIPYSPDLFTFHGSPLTGLRDDLGFAGLRLLYPLNPDTEGLDEVISFLGSSYFRALDTGSAYGSSARGLAVNIGIFDRHEEFPVFTKFWLIPRPILGPDMGQRVAALLESPSITGFYLFTINPGSPTTVWVQMILYPREKIDKLGIAPLTSMFLYGEAGAKGNVHVDHRPEVHDADGLLIQLDDEQTVWHPLENPTEHRTTHFEFKNIHSFGLMQRDKNVKHYNDFETNQHVRPSIIVSPYDISPDSELFPHDDGHLELLEIASHDEGMDNIGAYWILDQPVMPNSEMTFAYKLTFTHLPVEPVSKFNVQNMQYEKQADGRIAYTVTFIPNPKNVKENDQDITARVTADNKPVLSQVSHDKATGLVTVTFAIEPNEHSTKSLRAQLHTSSGAPFDISEIWSFTCPKTKPNP
jgi:glucans biosynthesis protein